MANPSRTTVSPELWTVNCAPECGFMVRNHNKNELVQLVQMHGKTTHSKTFSEKEVLGMAQSVRL